MFRLIKVSMTKIIAVTLVVLGINYGTSLVGGSIGNPYMFMIGIFVLTLLPLLGVGLFVVDSKRN